ncbi:DDHD domain [Trinorchestia longiramus]|nr:DDHD domain [Trinorchestia longiramus]
MSENINPLLFSASASVFDNISASSAVLLPPQTQNANSIGGETTDGPLLAVTTKTNILAGERPVISSGVTNSNLVPKVPQLPTKELVTSALPSNNFSQESSFVPCISGMPISAGIGLAPPAPLPASLGVSSAASYGGSQAATLAAGPPLSDASLLSQEGNDGRCRPYTTPSPAPSSQGNVSRSTTPGIPASLSSSFSSVLSLNNNFNSGIPARPSVTFPELSKIQFPHLDTNVLSATNAPQLLPTNSHAQVKTHDISSLSQQGIPLLPPTLPTQPLSTMPLTQALPTKPLTHTFAFNSSTQQPPPSTVPPGVISSSPSEAKATGGETVNSVHANVSNTWSPPVFGEGPEQLESPVLPPSFEYMASSGSSPTARYRPINPHWFYGVPGKPIEWKPFSFTDTINLEEAYRNGGCGLVSTDGGRYDVEVSSRVRRPVYWGSASADSTDHSTPVRRCSWFRKGPADLAPVPYEEAVAEKLEDAYRESAESGVWGRQVEVTGELQGLVVISSPLAMHHYSTSLVNAFPSSVSIAESQAPDVVKRGADDFSVADGECEQVDHLVFLVHGIGPVCDLSFRSVEQCVDSFRELGSELLNSHFRQSVESGRVGRVEVLPVSWHKALHSDADGIDQRLKPITLRSIPMLREFTNDTIVDVLLYTSPAYCQLIVDTVAGEINRMYKLFCERNPRFSGGASVAGHSLGSVILFDLLMHQKKNEDSEPESVSLPEGGSGVELLQQKGVGSVLTAFDIRAKRSQSASHDNCKSVHFELGTAGTGQPSIVYPQLLFCPQGAFLLGSPIAMFLSVRGLTQLSPQYQLPTCPHVFNIFHPYDPVAYRLETLIHPELTNLRPVLVPHHKGRKRMHLELKDTLERVGSDIKHKIVDSLQATWNKLYTLYSGNTTEQHIQQAEQEQLSRLGMEEEEDPPMAVGQLNAGRRIDYVLQEKPYESFTEYIFALQAHLSYWKSEDTLLLMLKEIYGFLGISCDTGPTHVATATAESMSSTSPSSSASPVYTATAPTPAPPVPMLPSFGSSSSAAPVLPPPLPTGNACAPPPMALSGRPLVDVASLGPGMDPTAEPQLSAVPPPPAGAALTFTRIRGGRRR